MLRDQSLAGYFSVYCVYSSNIKSLFLALGIHHSAPQSGLATECVGFHLEERAAPGLCPARLMMMIVMVTRLGLLAWGETNVRDESEV